MRERPHDRPRGHPINHCDHLRSNVFVGRRWADWDQDSLLNDSSGHHAPERGLRRRCGRNPPRKGWFNGRERMRQ